jgi:hypothetical protein
MISGNDIKNILRKEVLSWNLGIAKVTKDTHAPVTKDSNFERVVVNVLANKRSSWNEGYANINIFVPDISVRGYQEPDNARLTTLERLAISKVKKGFTGEFEGFIYDFTLDAVGQEDDPETFSHFINLKIHFQNI